MLGTSTHDSKRSEDVRARINVLSEIPQEWRKRVWRWRELNAGKKKISGGQESPTRNDEYFLYQTLVGAWPLPGDHSEPCFCQRIKEYMLKAIREAKQKTSWANQNKEYESEVLNFVEGILGAQAVPEFLEDFREFQQYVSRIGMLNSLSQTAIKLTLPGVPDIYQGTEVWDFTLVDPDNRRPVNYEQRRRLLTSLRKLDESSEQDFRTELSKIVSNPLDGRVKLYLTWRLLNLRSDYPDLFESGNYRPLEVKGSKSNHLVAYARQFRETTLLVAVSRLNAQLYGSGQELKTHSLWEDTTIEWPNGSGSRSFIDVLGRSKVKEQDAGPISASSLFSQFPVAVWICDTQ
jgi:(1->4)-alpha-D-glucan 1-alpha-D-glucosylmutase